MKKETFSAWCHKATEKIRYGPDRKEVEAELRAHLEDHRDALMDQGMSLDEATQKALEAMGSAEELAPQLAQIHHPLPGYLCSTTKVIAVISVLMAAFILISGFGSMIHSQITTRNYDSLPQYGELSYYGHPNVSTISDGYRFCVPEAAVSQNGNTFYFQLEILCWPWMEHTGAAYYFWAEDSLGNYYNPAAEGDHDDPTRITALGSQSTSGYSLNNMTLTGFSGEAQWVELHYDRDGRDLVLHIDLTGGDKS